MKTTKKWTCDKCHKPIQRVEDGWVQWLNAGEYPNIHAKDLQLVHHKPASPREKGCYFNKNLCILHTDYMYEDLPLRCFVGHDGLMMLLRLLDEEELPKAEVTEMIKRLHIPGYEDARHHFKSAIAADVFEPNTELGYHYQYQIEETLRFAQRQQRY